MTTAPPPPVRIEPHTNTLFLGGVLHIDDRGRLVEMVARLVVGQFLHVELVLRGSNTRSPRPPTLDMLATAKTRLGKPVSDELRWHRDGWVFQLISWVAARGASPTRTLATPHPQPTRQGFDCLYLEQSGNEPPILTICEEKATEKTRSVIREEVFPAFTTCEEGTRDAELQAELTTLLRFGRPDADVEAIIESVQWEDHKRYCATVTATTKQTKKPAKLYKDYEKAITGDRSRRTGNIFPEDDLRPWMDIFCAEVLGALEALVSAPAVLKTKP